MICWCGKKDCELVAAGLHRARPTVHISRQDINAALRDAPVPAHLCQNHEVDGHCTVCGAKLPRFGME